MPEPKRYGAREERSSFTPADPGHSLEELLELFDGPDELVHQLAKDLLAERASRDELAEKLALLESEFDARVSAREAELVLLRELERCVRINEETTGTGSQRELMIIDKLAAHRARPTTTALTDVVDDSGPTLEDRVVSCERAIADLRKLVHEINQRTIGMAK